MSSYATIEAATGVRTKSERWPRTPGALLLRFSTRLRRPWLDREIVRGVDRRGDRRLALREAQLIGRHERRRLARRLEEVLAPRAHESTPSSAIPIDQPAVDVARPILTELVLSLRSAEPVEARGVVLGWRLLTDAMSPLYAPPVGDRADRDRLWYESLAVLFALRPLTLQPATSAAR